MLTGSPNSGGAEIANINNETGMPSDNLDCNLNDLPEYSSEALKVQCISQILQTFLTTNNDSFNIWDKDLESILSTIDSGELQRITDSNTKEILVDLLESGYLSFSSENQNRLDELSSAENLNLTQNIELTQLKWKKHYQSMALSLAIIKQFRLDLFKLQWAPEALISSLESYSLAKLLENIRKPLTESSDNPNFNISSIFINKAEWSSLVENNQTIIDRIPVEERFTPEDKERLDRILAFTEKYPDWVYPNEEVLKLWNFLTWENRTDATDSEIDSMLNEDISTIYVNLSNKKRNYETKYLDIAEEIQEEILSKTRERKRKLEAKLAELQLELKQLQEEWIEIEADLNASTEHWIKLQELIDSIEKINKALEEIKESSWE